ncbi:hypothetical protein NXX89_07210 [Bacteroides thetaiotaomicron]|nr:hypothetical protein [Bacteroides thetaiotaomicron]MCS3211316.1 hypothetical protein [Bacteroides thetaiotaomicron]
MKKVTVKHYLNTNIGFHELNKSNGKPLNDEIFYPIYVQITFARKTTQIRSYTEMILTIKDYEYYQAGCYEKMTDVQDVKKYLVPEPKRIQMAIEYLLKRNEEISKNKNFPWEDLTINKFDDIRFEVEDLLGLMEDKLIDHGWMYLAIISQRFLKDPKSVDIHDAFRLEHNLLDSLNIIKHVTGYDLTPFFSQEELLFWKNINFLINRYKEEGYSFIDFIVNHEALINQAKEIKNKDTFIQEIKKLIYWI